VEICMGESATLTASGGGSYQWSNQQTGATISVSPAITLPFTVTVTNANNCTDSDEVEVIVNPLPAIDAGSDEEICEGESVTLSASGADTFLWSTQESTSSITVSPEETTTYSVTGTDANNCSATEDVVVEVNALPNADAGPDQEICEGESVTLTATGGGDYLWSDGQTTATISESPQNSQGYSVEVTSGEGCMASSSVNVVVNTLPSQPLITVDGSSLVSSQATGYQWYFNGQPIEGATDGTYTPIETGDYTVEVLDENGCSSISEIYNWITVGISERANEVSVHPNPFQNNLSINSTEEIRDIIVYDIRGKIIQQVKPSTNRILIETSAWANGIYHLQVFTDKNVLVSKVVKTE